MTNSAAGEYLEKYSVAPSPSRDYYGIKVLRDQVILYTWKISHGPHTSPIVRTSRFSDFGKEKTMQNEIERVFGKVVNFIGEPILRYVEAIARGDESTLLTLPKHLIKKLITYLTFRDILNLSTLSHIAKEVFNGDIVWEVLYKRHKMGLVYKDEREQGSYYGWKRLFKERQMHKSARNRKIKNPSSDQHLIASRSSTSLTKKSSISLSLKNHKDTMSAAKLPRGELQAQKFSDSKIGRNFSGRPNTANKKKTNADIEGCKLSNAKIENSDNDSLAKIDTLKTITLGKMVVKSVREPEKDSSVQIFKSTSVGGRREKSIGKGASGDETKNSDEKTGSCKSSAVSNILAGKHSDQKSECLAKKFPHFEQKSNPSLSGMGKSTKSVRNAESQPRWCEQKTLRNGAKKPQDSKSSGRSEICKTEKALLGKDRGVSLDPDFGLEELIRASVTEEYLNSDSFLPPDFWQDRTYDTNSNSAKKSAQKYSKDNFHTVEPPAKKLTDAKASLKRNGKNFCGDGAKLENCRVEGKVSSMKSVPQKMVTKYKNRAALKTESCDSFDSKFIATKSSQRLGPKKRGNSKQL